MKKIKRLEKEKQLLQEIYELKMKIKELENRDVYIPYYPRPFEYPVYPNHPIITYGTPIDKHIDTLTTVC